MINLIPRRARKDVKVEYWVRVISAWLFLMSFAMTIIGVLLVPSVVMIRAQLEVYSSSYQQASKENSANKQSVKQITTANAVSQKLVTADKDYLFTDLLVGVENSSDRSIVLDSILMERTDGVVEEIQLTGTAATRGALVQFRDSLEAHKYFNSIELPLSNLAKDKDIPFNITATVGKQDAQ